MKAPKLLSILLFSSVCVPTAAAAQIVIDRYNQDGDPTQSAKVVKKDDGDKSDDGKSDDGDEGEDGDKKKKVEDKSLTPEDLEVIHAALLKQLEKTHAQCLKQKEIVRPDAANITGTATWQVDEEGTAKFVESSVEVGIEMFVLSDKQLEKMTPAQRKVAQATGTEMYTKCAQGSDAKTKVEGKEGEVQVSFTVSHAGERTSVTLDAPQETGGARAIEL